MDKGLLQLDRKHPLAIRWMHWINFPILFVMIWSGLLIYWNDSDNAYQHPHAVYRVGVGSWTVVRFFPDWFWKAVDAPYHVTQGLGHHFFFMWIFLANGVAYVLFLMMSGEWRFLVPEGRSVRDAIQVTLVDLHLRKGLPPQTKYNGAQRIAYSSVIVMGAGMVITGLAIYKPTQMHWLTTVLGGYEMARWEHFWLTMGFLGFFLVHVGQVVLAGWNNFRAMVSGYEIKRTDETVGRSGKEVLVMATIEEQNEAVRAQSRTKTRRSFVGAAVAAAAGFGVYSWLERTPDDGGQPEAYRKAFLANAAISRGVFQEKALSPTYPMKRAETLRVNGVYGLKEELVPASYRLQVVGARSVADHPRYSRDVTAWEYQYTRAQSGEDKGHDTKVAPSSGGAVRESRTRGQEEAGPSDSTLAPGTPGLLLTMEDVLKLPRHELVTQFKCIEGWSQIVHWAGVRMADFLEAYPPDQIAGQEPKYVYMETPDGDYYTGYDMQVCRHPQTLLVTEMMGAPLTQFHGAPLRLHMPTKYGYKQIKRIGLIRYTNDRPDDYWTKLGYDWYAGL